MLYDQIWLDDNVLLLTRHINIQRHLYIDINPFLEQNQPLTMSTYFFLERQCHIDILVLVFYCQPAQKVSHVSVER